MTECFMCGKECVLSMDQLQRSLLPKELLGPGEVSNVHDLVEDLRPICKKCNEFRKVVDAFFIALCEDAKLWEWYRSDSKSRGVWFPPQLVYNISLDRLRELYFEIMDVCEEAYRVSNDDEVRQNLRDEFNYAWRKRDA